eukprot:scaffold36983_cov67-Phaeocystis_antarctica.AAC.5
MVVSKPRKMRHASNSTGIRSTQPVSISRCISVTISHQKKVGSYSLCKKAVACTIIVFRLCRSAFRIGRRTSKRMSGIPIGHTSRKKYAMFVITSYSSGWSLPLQTTCKSALRKVRISPVAPSSSYSRQSQVSKMPLETVGQSTKETRRAKGAAATSASLSHRPRVPRPRTWRE